MGGYLEESTEETRDELMLFSSEKDLDKLHKRFQGVAVEEEKVEAKDETESRETPEEEKGDNTLTSTLPLPDTSDSDLRAQLEEARKEKAELESELSNRNKEIYDMTE